MAYPASLDELTDGVPSDGAAPTTDLGDATFPHDDHHRALAVAVEAVQAELGTDPAGASATVAARFDALSSGAVSVIARTVLGSDTASVDFTGIPATYENLMATYLARGTGSNLWSRVYLRLNGDSGSNYQSGSGGRTGVSFVAVDGASGQAQMTVGLLPDASATAAYPAAGTLTVAGYARTVFNKVVSCVDVSPASTAIHGAILTGGLWASTAAVNQVTFLASSGNFVAGSVFTLYGVAGA